MIKAYYTLTKPGIIYGNALTAAGGFFLAAHGIINISLFFAMLFGLSCIIASACVFNNILDRNIDAKMKRTKFRPLVQKVITVKQAFIFASFLSIIGTLILSLYTNSLTLSFALLGLFFYVVVYGIAKRYTVHSTIIGCISGALPPVVGYCSVTNQFDLVAFFLFTILIFWQMPHFYAIGMFRLEEYKTAGLPIWPSVKGAENTKQKIIVYVVGFLTTISLLTAFHFIGYIYLFVMVTISLLWLLKGIRGFGLQQDIAWAKSMFLFSLVVITVFSVMISVGPVLP
ncbi:MAG: heme o synthase [Candidatus Levyibacteriota bacterium]